MPAFDIPSDGTWYLDVNGASKHLNTDVQYNETNPGLGLSYQWDEDSNIIKLIKLGQYLNSLDEQSQYLGAGIKKRFGEADGLHLDVGGLAGLLTGYNDDITPALLPMLTIGNGAFGVNILATPEIEGYTPATIMFSTEIPLK